MPCGLPSRPSRLRVSKTGAALTGMAGGKIGFWILNFGCWIGRGRCLKREGEHRTSNAEHPTSNRREEVAPLRPCAFFSSMFGVRCWMLDVRIVFGGGLQTGESKRNAEAAERSAAADRLGNYLELQRCWKVAPAYFSLSGYLSVLRASAFRFYRLSP